MSTPCRKRRKSTMIRNPHFDAQDAARTLWAAVQGLGTDEEAIIEVVSSCNNAQRQEIKREFELLYQKDLIKELMGELRIRLSLDFKDLLLALFRPPLANDAFFLKDAVKGFGTNERCLVEVLLTRTPSEIQDIRTEYHRNFKKLLEHDVADDTSGDFRKFCFTLSRGKRTVSNCVNEEKARDIAREIHRTYTDFKGTDKPRYDFIGLCCCEGYPQLRAVFKAYEEITNESIITFIEREFSGDVEEGLKWTVKCSQSIPAFFAERLHKSMEGLGKHLTLTRIVVSRSEIDLSDIRNAYEQKYGKSLEEKVKSHTKGGFKKLLAAIIRGNSPDQTVISA